MDVKIEAAPFAANVELIEAVVMTIVSLPVFQALSQVERVASSSCPTLGSHSISAVAPDHNFKEDLANAA